METPLRTDAEGRLAGGTAPHSETSPIGLEALRLLHRLASSPESAADALRLLHELQVHQVELDLQLAQVRSNEQELAEEVASYRELYQRAPAGYFRLDPDSRITEVNQAGSELLGVEQSQLIGRRVESFVAPDSQQALAGLLSRLRSGGARDSCRVQVAGRTPRQNAVLATADAASDGSLLLLLVDISDPGP